MSAAPPPTPTTPPAAPPVLFFDGHCGLCNRIVDRLLRADRRGVLRFSPLQGETARRLLPALPPDPATWAIVYVDETGTYRASDAALRACRRLGGLHAALGALLVLPRGLRDLVYRAVARRRYRWFGRRDTCRVPTAAERERFLP